MAETTSKPAKKEHKDQSRDDIMDMATKAIDRSGGTARVYFKYTCQHCGERCSFTEANVLYEEGECHKCGKLTQINEAGFMLVLTIPKIVEKERK